MIVPQIGFGKPQECHGRILLPVVALISECHGSSAIGSATILALFILEGDQVYFTVLSEEISREDILLCIGKGLHDRALSAEKGEE